MYQCFMLLYQLHFFPLFLQAIMQLSLLCLGRNTAFYRDCCFAFLGPSLSLCLCLEPNTQLLLIDPHLYCSCHLLQDASHR